MLPMRIVSGKPFQIIFASRLTRSHYCKTMLSKIAGTCDINVTVDGDVFQCHRIVLSAASDYFQVMFSGNFKEGSGTEVTLQDIAANVFEEILEFMYTGEAVIRAPEVYDLIRAAEFYKLPLLMDLCTQFVKKNLNAVAEDILKIFSFARNVKVEKLVQLLVRHIHKNFGYFSTTLDFLNLTFDSLMEILNLLDGTQPGGVHDLFLEGIHTWVTHQASLTAAERESYLNRLMKKVDLTKLSFDYTRYKIERSMKELTVLSRSTDDAKPVSNSFQKSTRLLHAFVSKISSQGSALSTSVFALNSIPMDPYFKWTYSGEVECCADFMRNIAIDDQLYSLRFSRYTNSPQQTFSSGSAISMYPYVALKPPPRILDEFDMCGTANEIYVYHRNSRSPITTIPLPEDPRFSEDELYRGLYSYKRDIDQWFPLPSPPESISVNACMTCDEERVYLIGSSNSSKTVQAYDPRTRGWSTLPKLISTYDKHACCVFKKEIYVIDSDHTILHKYDPRSKYWLPYFLESFHSSKFEQHQLVNWHGLYGREDWLVNFNRTLSFDSKIIYFDNISPTTFAKSLPSLFDVVSNNISLSFYDNFFGFPKRNIILDMVSF